MALVKEPIPRVAEDVLIENREELVRQIKPADIINSLLQRRVIDLDDFKAISRIAKENRRAGVEKLLSRVHRSGPKGLDKFIDSLKSSGYPSLAKKLQDSHQPITKSEQEIPSKSSTNRLQESCQTLNRTEQETSNKSSAKRLHKSSQTINRAEQETPNESSANRQQESCQTLNRTEQETSNKSSAKRLHKSSQTINRAEQETPIESSANRLQESSQTINRTEQETPNKSPANVLQESSQTINRTEQETPNKSSANRLQESSQTINRTEQEAPNKSSANRLQESSQTINRTEQETPNKSSANRLQESSQTINRTEQEAPNKSSAERLQESCQTTNRTEQEAPNKSSAKRLQESCQTTNRTEQEAPNKSSAKTLQESCQTTNRTEQEAPNKSSANRLQESCQTTNRTEQEAPNKSSAERLQESHQTTNRTEQEAPNKSSAKTLQESCQTTNRTEQEAPNESSANRLQESSQTINRTEQEIPNESSANRLQESSQTINRTEQEAPNKSSANRLQESHQTINRTEQEAPNKSSANRLQESSQTINRTEQEIPNESSANRLQESHQTINGAAQETPNASSAKRLQESCQTITKRAEAEKTNKLCVEEKNDIKRSEITEKGAAAEPTTNDTRCIILLGKSGVGKGSVGNNLLGSERFRRNKFQGGTVTCKVERTDNMVVMNTPGIFSTFRSNTDVAEEIMGAIEVNELLINVYILVLSVEERFSGDELESVEFIKQMFGENVINNMIIVFVGRDFLTDDKFQFPSCLPQLRYFILDSKHTIQEELEDIEREIFSEKYKTPDEFYVNKVDWDSIEREDRRRKDSQQPKKSSLKQVKDIIEKGVAAESTTTDTRCIILLGKIGVGKSSLGNILLGARKFSKSIFKCRRTKDCQIKQKDNLVIVNTPGFFSRSRSDVDVANEIMNTIEVNKLLINVYILVLSVEERLSGERLNSVKFIKKLFGENVINNMIIVFTRKYSLKDDEFQFLRCLPQIPYFILDCKHRKQEEVEEIRKEIFSEKYRNIPDVLDAEQIDWGSIKEEERRRKDSQQISLIHFKEITEKGAAAEPTTTDTRCIILLGKIGVGKSSLGNNLLSARKFCTNRMIDRRTKVCQIERTDNIIVMDTPGFFSRFRSDFDLAKEIMNTIELNKLSVNVYILVLSANRFSGEYLESVEFIKKLFGENVIKNMIIVFTGKDSLQDDKLPSCLAQTPYFLLDCEYGKREEMEKIRKEIFSEKYRNIPDVFHVNKVDWASIEREKRRVQFKTAYYDDIERVYTFLDGNQNVIQ